jgi:RNA polymerase sigma-70 factor (ECF subfamily)
MASVPDSTTRISLLGRLAKAPLDEAAWREFVTLYGGKIYAWCRHWKLQEADAQDVTQNVLVKLLQTMRNFEYDPSRSFRAWLKTVTHHAWRNLMESQQRAGQYGGNPQVGWLLQQIDASADLVKHLDDAFDQEIFEEAARRVRLRVAPQTWEAFRLTALEGISGTEASERLGMQVGHVFVAKHRVQKLLQEEVQKLEGAADGNEEASLSEVGKR